MDRATYQRESALNRRAYETMRDQIHRDYAGKYVALANGKAIGADASFDVACALVESLQPPPEYFVVFAAEDEPDFGLVYDFRESV